MGERKAGGHVLLPCLGSRSLTLFAKCQYEIRQLCKQNQGPGQLPRVVKIPDTEAGDVHVDVQTHGASQGKSSPAGGLSGPGLTKRVPLAHLSCCVRIDVGGYKLQPVYFTRQCQLCSQMLKSQKQRGLLSTLPTLTF